MPLEIKELHIRIAVNTSETAQPATGQTPAPAAANTGDAEAVNAIVGECVEQVLQILQSKMER